ncbi:TetR/AcrR family transcriptional regulator [Nocardia brasiliensis]
MTTEPSREERSHRRDGIRSRQALLDAAVTVAAQRGLAGVTHRAVTETARVPATSVAYYFGSIENLVQAALEEFTRAHIARLDAMSTAETDADEFVAGIVAVTAAAPRELVLAQYETYLAAARNPATRELTDAVLAAYERTAAAGLRRIGVPDPQSHARWITSIVDGYLLQSLARADGLDTDGLRQGLTLLLAAARQLPDPRRFENTTADEHELRHGREGAATKSA